MYKLHIFDRTFCPVYLATPSPVAFPDGSGEYNVPYSPVATMVNFDSRL